MTAGVHQRFLTHFIEDGEVTLFVAGAGDDDG